MTFCRESAENLAARIVGRRRRTTDQQQLAMSLVFKHYPGEFDFRLLEQAIVACDGFQDLVTYAKTLI